MILTVEIFLAVVGIILTAFALGYAVGRNTKKVTASTPMDSVTFL